MIFEEVIKSSKMYEKTDFFGFSETNIGMSSFTDEFLWVGFENWVLADIFTIKINVK